MDRRNKRDAKFLIFQSLYIIAISILFYKGTDLSLNKVTEIKEDEIVVSRAILDSMSKWPTYDSLKQVVKPKLPTDEKYEVIREGEVVVDGNEYNRIKRIAETKPAPQKQIAQPKDDRHKSTIKGETPK